MPTPREDETRKEFVKRCIPVVIDDGTAKNPDQAVAICNGIWEKAMETKAAMTKKEADGEHPSGHYLVVEDPKEVSTWHLRVKDMNGSPDHRLMGAAWAALHGGYRGNKYEGPDKQKAINKLIRLYRSEKMELPSEKEFAETLIAWGGAVKALGDGKIGGYLVRFSTEEDPDLEGEYFTKDTDFGDAESAPVYYQHGMDTKIGKRRIGRAQHRIDDFGVWAEAQLNLRDEYEKFIYAMAEKGKMGWSSGTANHLVERQISAKATWIKSWPLGLDDTLTPVPAEPRNEAMPLKSWQPEILEITMADKFAILNGELKTLDADLSELVENIDRPLTETKRKELLELLELCQELDAVRSNLKQILDAEPHGRLVASREISFQLAEMRKRLKAKNIIEE